MAVNAGELPALAVNYLSPAALSSYSWVPLSDSAGAPERATCLVHFVARAPAMSLQISDCLCDLHP